MMNTITNPAGLQRSIHMVGSTSESQDVDNGSEVGECTCKQVSTNNEGHHASDLVDDEGHKDHGINHTDDTVDTLSKEEVEDSDAELGVKNGTAVGEDVDTGQLIHASGLNFASDSSTFSHGPSTPKIGDLVGADSGPGCLADDLQFATIEALKRLTENLYSEAFQCSLCDPLFPATKFVK
jgi:hypothetical protein